LTGCSQDAYTVASTSNGPDTIELRYSPSCQTNWARAWIGSGNPNAVSIRRQDGLYYQTNITYDTLHWSQMVYAPTMTANAKLTWGGGSSWSTGYH